MAYMRGMITFYNEINEPGKNWKWIIFNRITSLLFASVCAMLVTSERGAMLGLVYVWIKTRGTTACPHASLVHTWATVDFLLGRKAIIGGFWA